MNNLSLASQVDFARYSIEIVCLFFVLFLSLSTSSEIAANLIEQSRFLVYRNVKFANIECVHRLYFLWLIHT